MFSASLLAQVVRSAKCFSSTTKVGTPYRSACSRPDAGLSDPTAKTLAGNSGFFVACNSASRFDPEPEIKTTTESMGLAYLLALPGLSASGLAL